MCLGPDIHKAASPAARWNHAFPYTLALTAKTPPPTHAHIQKKSALAERKPQLNFTVPLLLPKWFYNSKGQIHGIAVLELRSRYAFLEASLYWQICWAH